MVLTSGLKHQWYANAETFLIGSTILEQKLLNFLEQKTITYHAKNP